MQDEIINPFSNFNDCAVDIWKWIVFSSHILYWIRLFIHAGINIDPCQEQRIQAYFKGIGAIVRLFPSPAKETWRICVRIFHKSNETLVIWNTKQSTLHYDDVIMTMLASQITSLTVVYSIVYSGVNQRKHQSSASLAFVQEIHRGPVNFPHKWPVTRKMFPFDDVVMKIMWIFHGMLCFYYNNTNCRAVQSSDRWQMGSHNLIELMYIIHTALSSKWVLKGPILLPSNIARWHCYERRYSSETNRVTVCK